MKRTGIICMNTSNILLISEKMQTLAEALFLLKLQQQSDETPMVWEMLLYIYILHSPDWHYQSTMPTFLFLYGAAFAIVHSQVHFGIGFKIHYVILCLLCIPRMYKYYIHTQDMSAKRLAKLHLATGVESKSSSLSGSSSIREDSETKDTVSTGNMLTMGWFISKDMFEIGVGRNTLFHLILEMCSDLNP
ncbi:Alkaline ceramidase [Vitis vinifera]|uniref:Alkaline ceramidase n=1 Tax=Vitis vinifera TaxID=29760 RepID=A0A438CYF5_VITVI|nr:Alkaline ceramidase [Vitis vinifera]